MFESNLVQNVFFYQTGGSRCVKNQMYLRNQNDKEKQNLKRMKYVHCWGVHLHFSSQCARLVWIDFFYLEILFYGMMKMNYA
jgi:hypothetical protein